MKPFREINADGLESAALKEQMASHGYAMIRGLLYAEDLNPLLKEIAQTLRDAGWLESSTDPILRAANPASACADGDPDYKPARDRVFGLQSLHAFLHHPSLKRLLKMLVGEHLLIHPRPETRLVFPNYDRGVIHAHQDHTAVAGDEESFTAWIALHDCPLVQGPLRILDGSHRFGLQPTIDDTGYIPRGEEQGDGWVGGDVNAGDVLLFHSLTVHEAIPNRSDQLRISVDFRFQSYDREVNPAVFVFTGSGARSWDRVYANWTSDELKYYWTKLPLRLKPSKSELIELSQSSTSPRLRERYGRILERLRAQMPNA
jgi:ectoine hydroxylase-related dioxygenase (phytanoyl-CoA dioxygenase family)